MAAQSDNTPKIKSAHPSDFDGTYSRFRPWLREVKVKILIDKLQAEQDKILCAIQYMKKGQAAEFRDMFLDLVFAKEPLDFGTWEEFEAQLKARFTDQLHKDHVRERVEHFRQGRLPVQEFLVRIEQMFDQAELTSEEERIRILKKNVDPDVLRIIYNSDHIPGTHQAWVTKISKVGQLQEQLRQIQADQRRTTPFFSSRPHEHPPQRPPTQPPAQRYNISVNPNVPSKDASKPKYEPMDVDRIKTTRCYNCQELGHMRKECPKPACPRVNVREMWEQLDDDEKEELYVEVRAMELEKEEDGQDFGQGR